MASEHFTVIQEFLDKVNPKDSKVHEAIGLSERNYELFWSALTAADENLKIANLTKVGKKALSTEHPSAYINHVAKANLIKRGDVVGEWLIASPAIKKMKAVLSGEAVEESVGEQQTVARRKTQRSSQREKVATGLRLTARIAKKTVGDMVAKLKSREVEIDAEITRLEEERDAIPRRIQEVIKMFAD